MNQELTINHVYHETQAKRPIKNVQYNRLYNLYGCKTKTQEKGNSEKVKSKVAVFNINKFEA